jgi:hypothetical protein
MEAYSPEDFRGFHIQDLGDAALHDEEVRVVDVELDRMEQILRTQSPHVQLQAAWPVCVSGEQVT